MLAWLWFLVAFFPAYFVHELGHVLVGWLQGAKGAVISFGRPGDHPVVNLNCRLFTLRVHAGLSLWIVPPTYRFGLAGRPSAVGVALRAAAGPLASLILFTLATPDLGEGVRGLLAFSYPVNSFRTALAFWGAMSTVFPLVPLRYRQVGVDSDGLLLLMPFAPWLGRNRMSDPTLRSSHGKEGYMDVFLETERLALRRFTEADVDHLLDLDSDPDVMRYLTGGKPTPRNVMEKEFLPKVLRRYDHPAEYGFWAAIEKSSGNFIGWFEFKPLDEPGTVELGYRLRKSAWGKGYASEGSRALIRKGFTELGVRRVMATTMSVNTASRRVMERVGLKYVRTYHWSWPDPIPGAEEGEVEYALTKAEWEERERHKNPL